MNDAEDPVGAFRAAAEAVEREDWLAAALLCDPFSLDAFKRQRRRKFTALGTVLDGDRLAYVLYRVEYDASPGGEVDADAAGDWMAGLSAREREFAADIAKGPPSMATCRRQADGSWRLVAGHGFLGVGNMVFAIGSGEDRAGLEEERPEGR